MPVMFSEDKVSMPQMNGIETALQICKLLPKCSFSSSLGIITPTLCFKTLYGQRGMHTRDGSHSMDPVRLKILGR